MAAELKETLSEPLNHHFMFGKVLPEIIEKIGGEIDLVILDTVHFLPGEILDFPVVLPYMSDNGIVILHDVGYCHYNNKDGLATQVLLDVATGEKIIPMGSDTEKPTAMPNIAAIKINADTKKYINSVFDAMIIPWWYLPIKNELAEYRKFYTKFYDEKFVNVFDTAVELNTKMLKYRQPFKRRIRLAARMIIRGY